MSQEEINNTLKNQILEQMESSLEFRDVTADILVEFYKLCTVGNPMTFMVELGEVFKSLDSELKKIC